MSIQVEIIDHGDDHDEQARYLCHSYDDVLWTDSLDDALRFLRADLVRHHRDGIPA